MTNEKVLVLVLGLNCLGSCVVFLIPWVFGDDRFAKARRNLGLLFGMISGSAGLIILSDFLL